MSPGKARPIAQVRLQFESFKGEFSYKAVYGCGSTVIAKSCNDALPLSFNTAGGPTVVLHVESFAGCAHW
ncbi:hypothetical protein K466DRAFT_586679 [Polyporus arcularius HHB13444]|uniref:Uncharacterized protein n=1 Tax=Polyporus arcularius HHB13444 TaxID=1314778 RepID=A0A5C3PBG3_9APHY|nr:hypothetical protein K466DRAFT_586679 [Polyporus arcularius HHB13444]